MSNSLDQLAALAANYPTSSTIQLSAASYCTLLFVENLLSSRSFWIDRKDPYDAITDEQWDTLQAVVDSAYRELMTPMIGQIVPLVVAALPLNMLPCDGSNYLRVDYPDLYAALDAAFIVDTDNFVTPDLRGRTVIGSGSGSGLSSRSVGSMLGTEKHSLSGDENGNHAHSDIGHSHADVGHTHVDGNAVPTVITIGAGVPAPSAIPAVGVTAVGFANIATGFASIQSSGLGTAHENMQPSLVLRYGVIAR